MPDICYIAYISFQNMNIFIYIETPKNSINFINCYIGLTIFMNNTYE